MKLPIEYDKLSVKQKAEVREQYYIEQKGLCYHCHSPLDLRPPQDVLEKKLDMSLFPRHFLKHPIHLHHSHKTGMTIGVVHAYCNGVLWEYYNE